MHASFQLFDIAIIVIYFILTFAVGFYYSKETKSSSQYFLAGRHTGWVVIGASLFATNVSSEHFVGLAGTGFQGGMAAGNYEFMGALSCILLAWTFGPLYLRNGVFTAPEFIGKRFNNFCRVYLSVGSIVAYILTKISMMLLAGGIFLAKVVGLDIYTSAIILVIATGIYTVSGGLSSVIYTGAVQAVIMIVGAIILAAFGYIEVGGVQALWHKIPAQDWQLIKPITDVDFPWTGLVFGMPIVCIWYHCTDQFFLHKFLASKDITHAQAGSIFTAYLKLIPIFTLLVPGLIARVLYPSISADDAYPTMVMTLLPIGLKGLVIAAFLSALMSSLSSCFSSCSTLFTLDIYKKMYPQANDFVIVNVGRIMTFVIVILGIIWVIFIKSVSGELYMYLQGVTAYIAPPIVALFIIGLSWPRANESGAVAGLIAGFVFGSIRFLTEIFIRKSHITSGFFYELGSINFLHFSAFLFLACAVVMILVSSFTKRPSDDKIHGLTFKYANVGGGELGKVMLENKTMSKGNVIASVVFLFIVIILYMAFQGFFF